MGMIADMAEGFPVAIGNIGKRSLLAMSREISKTNVSYGGKDGIYWLSGDVRYLMRKRLG